MRLFYRSDSLSHMQNLLRKRASVVVQARIKHTLINLVKARAWYLTIRTAQPSTGERKSTTNYGQVSRNNMLNLCCLQQKQNTTQRTNTLVRVHEQTRTRESKVGNMRNKMMSAPPNKNASFSMAKTWHPQNILANPHTTRPSRHVSSFSSSRTTCLEGS